MGNTFFKNLYKYSLALKATALTLFIFLPLHISAQNQTEVKPNSNSFMKAPTEIKWAKQAEGLYLGSTLISNPVSSFKSELVLLRINLDHFKLQVADSRQHGPSLNTVKALTLKNKAFAGINANFYGRNDKPLGLVISEGKTLNQLHRSGSVLTGVFYLVNNKPRIAHRDNFQKISPTLALQAGPRIISDKKKLSFKKSNGPTRRSGIAITSKNEIILYATKSRFPGARLEDIQDVFSMPTLAVTDVLNFDGGGSSQFYFSKSTLTGEVSKKTNSSISEINISGGDPVPIALVVTKK